MAASLPSIASNVRFVTALDGSNGLDLAELVNRGVLAPNHIGLGVPMTLGEVACYLSHERAWRLMARSGHRAALICEDDIRFSDPLIDLDALSRALPNDGDILYLYYLNDGTKNPSGYDIDAAIGPDSRFVGAVGDYSIHTAWSCGGTQSYLLTAKGVSKILEACRPIRSAVDGFLGGLSFRGALTTYALRPRAVEEVPFPSAIR